MKNNLIPKEDIGQFLLIPAAVDNSEYWKETLPYAVRLGNEFKGKTTLTFETAQGQITVETTLWSLTSKYIQLKGGTTIPLKSIVNANY